MSANLTVRECACGCVVTEQALDDLLDYSDDQVHVDRDKRRVIQPARMCKEAQQLWARSEDMNHTMRDFLFHLHGNGEIDLGKTRE